MADHREYAFNFMGIAYDHQLPSNLTQQHCWINFSKKSNKPIEDGMKAPPVVPSQIELQAFEEPIPRGLFVGMFTFKAANTSFVTDGSVRGRKKAAKIRDDNLPSLTPHDSDAFRVVVPPEGTKLFYYALIEEGEELCGSRLVKQNDVYFFRQFRDAEDDVTSTSVREKGWTDKIIQLVKIKQTKASAEKVDPHRNPSLDFSLEAVTLVDQYAKTNDIRYINVLESRAQSLLENREAGNEPSYLKIPHMLNRNIAQNFSEAQASGVVMEMKVSHHSDIGPRVGIMANTCRLVGQTSLPKSTSRVE